MRFVTPKTESHKILSVLHRMRESLVHVRTKTANQIHGFLLEFGISLPEDLASMKRWASVLAEHELPFHLMILLQHLHDHFVYLDEQIKALDKELAANWPSKKLSCVSKSMLGKCQLRQAITPGNSLGKPDITQNLTMTWFTRRWMRGHVEYCWDSTVSHIK